MLVVPDFDQPKKPSIRPSLRAAISGILGQDDVEPVERLHQRLQEARPGTAVQGNGKAGRLSGSTAGITTLGSVQGGHHPKRGRPVPVQGAVG